MTDSDRQAIQAIRHGVVDHDTTALYKENAIKLLAILDAETARADKAEKALAERQQVAARLQDEVRELWRAIGDARQELRLSHKHCDEVRALNRALRESSAWLEKERTRLRAEHDAALQERDAMGRERDEYRGLHRETTAANERLTSQIAEVTADASAAIHNARNSLVAANDAIRERDRLAKCLEESQTDAIAERNACHALFEEVIALCGFTGRPGVVDAVKSVVVSRDAWKKRASDAERQLHQANILLNATLDDPRDRLWHAEDGTWWRRETTDEVSRIVSADEPEPVQKLRSERAKMVKTIASAADLLNAFAAEVANANKAKAPVCKACGGFGRVHVPGGNGDSENCPECQGVKANG